MRRHQRPHVNLKAPKNWRVCQELKMQDPLTVRIEGEKHDYGYKYSWGVNDII